MGRKSNRKSQSGRAKTCSDRAARKAKKKAEMRDTKFAQLEAKAKPIRRGTPRPAGF